MGIANSYHHGGNIRSHLVAKIPEGSTARMKFVTSEVTTNAVILFRGANHGHNSEMYYMVLRDLLLTANN